MGKRRTRKQKETAKHAFTIKWSPDLTESQIEPRKEKTEPNVKRQFDVKAKSEPYYTNKEKDSVISTKSNNLKRIKKDIVRSLTIAMIIMGIELMLYLALKG